MEHRTINLLRAQNIYTMACEAALRIFELSRKFPHGGKDSIYNTIIESSGTVCTFILEAWQNRASKDVFFKKLGKAATKVRDTQEQIERAIQMELLDNDTGEGLNKSYENINEMINNIVQSPTF